MPRHARDRFLALVDELLATADQRCDPGAGDRDQADEPGDEQRVVAPQHHRREHQRHQAADDVEHQIVGEILEPGSEAQHPLGQRTSEVVMEERRILRQQLIHADHVEVLDSMTFEADHAVEADPPHDLGEKQHPRESEHIRHRRANPSQRVAGKAADQLSDNQRRDVENARVPQRRQQHRGHREAPEPGHLAAVAAQREHHRPFPGRRATTMYRRSHLSPVPSNQPGYGARPGASTATGFPGRYPQSRCPQ